MTTSPLPLLLSLLRLLLQQLLRIDDATAQLLFSIFSLNICHVF